MTPPPVGFFVMPSRWGLWKESAMDRTRLHLLSRAGVLSFADEPAGEAGTAPTGAADGDNGTQDADTDDSDEPLREPGRKALQSERKRAADEKRRADAAEARLQEIADAEKSELERAQERIAELEKATKAYEDEKARGTLRASVLVSKNVPSEWADFVTGDSEDEMNKSADRILENLSRSDTGPALRATHGNPGGSVEAGREAAKNYRP